MNLANRTMYVLRRKGTNKYKKNNGHFEELVNPSETKSKEEIDNNNKSAIKLYETAALCESSVRRCHNYKENYDFVKVKVTLELEEDNT